MFHNPPTVDYVPASELTSQTVSGTVSHEICRFFSSFTYFISHAVNCVRFCFWRCLWLFLCMKYLGNRWTDFVPNSQGKRARSLVRSSLKVKVNFGSLRAAYVWKNTFTL